MLGASTGQEGQGARLPPNDVPVIYVLLFVNFLAAPPSVHVDVLETYVLVVLQRRLVLVQAHRPICGLTNHLLLLHEVTSETTAADVLICNIEDERVQRAVYAII